MAVENPAMRNQLSVMMPQHEISNGKVTIRPWYISRASGYKAEVTADVFSDDEFEYLIGELTEALYERRRHVIAEYSAAIEAQLDAAIEGRQKVKGTNV